MDQRRLIAQWAAFGLLALIVTLGFGWWCAWLVFRAFG